ncbi:lyase family protein [Spirochaeta africana]|uniref:Fumarase n=1 Tax=Spirochaeta africana (strain ATCC 700263 / DSM 8902 / Z-7692) TaxID=889378 RepID=H9UK26_SPIAZ|nr:lyase family protein [Spirochaeta africana]AFG37869.1 fumarase [Spirochaeta africana DSM 8902]
MAPDKRTERDSLGEVVLPADAAWGAQTQRAVDNFTFSGYPMPAALRRSVGLVKAAAANANAELGRLDPDAARAVRETALQIWQGELGDAFPVEVFQTGSGTSWNMNANEVIARLAAHRLGSRLHPNDHVNMGQSSNDVIPTAINLACLELLEPLCSSVDALAAALRSKGQEFADIVKLGRTHLQDAVPVRLGDAFAAVAAQLAEGTAAVRGSIDSLRVVALGGTAAGTGLNTHPQFAAAACRFVSESIGYEIQPAAVPSAEMNSRLPQVQLMGALQLLTATLQRWCIDLRLMSSGPNGGLGEINLPELQPGSSIMPGKINPVIPEAVQQLAVHVQGKVAVVAQAAAQGPLELNIMFPLIAWETLESMRLLKNACDGLRRRCIEGITANPQICREQVERSLALITRVADDIGYDRAARIALQAQRERRSLRDVLMTDEGFSAAECDRLLDPLTMLPPFS